VIRNENVFAVLMDAVRVCSLGQITNALFQVGDSTGGVCSPIARFPIDALKQVGPPAFFGVTIASVLLVVAIDTDAPSPITSVVRSGCSAGDRRGTGRIALARSDTWVSMAGRLVALIS
jgi:hypothetical protein